MDSLPSAPVATFIVLAAIGATALVLRALNRNR